MQLWVMKGAAKARCTLLGAIFISELIMKQIVFGNFGFSYPESEKSLEGINLNIEKGEFIVLCGKSGCGKTTFLRQLKPAVAPVGETEGRILLDGTDIKELSEYDAAFKTGMVFQDPESGIVTDKVWHELAFGLESLGMSSDAIRLRVAEMAEFLGLNEYFNRKTSELSGGMKQLLNLASVMAMAPEVLLLDEPTSQLDPVAASNFLSTVYKINRELGITVIITEHRLEELLGYADRVLVMDNGRIKLDCSPRELCSKGGLDDDYMSLLMPSAVKIYNAVGGGEGCPLTVNEAAKWLRGIFAEEPKIRRIDRTEKHFERNAVELKNISFRYEKGGDDILENLSLKVPEGSVFAVLGGNGEGKSTLLKLICGAEKPVYGKVKTNGRISMLPQNVQTLFAKNTVREELCEVCGDDERIKNISSLTDIEKILDKHPYDISGGEQQRAALAKILLTDPDILLLDEPTKGMDCEFKLGFAEILKSLGKTVIMVSHDVEFCAENADFCAMLFDGKIVSCSTAADFFSGNFFYTTCANRISRHVFENCVTDKEVIALCRENLKK